MAYASRTLTSTDGNDALAIIFAVHKFHQYESFGLKLHLVARNG